MNRPERRKLRELFRSGVKIEMLPDQSDRTFNFNSGYAHGIGQAMEVLGFSKAELWELRAEGAALARGESVVRAVNAANRIEQIERC
jgi:hypothetical protein